MSRPAVSRHLRVLRESGLVEAHSDGQRQIYSLRHDALDELRLGRLTSDPCGLNGSTRSRSRSVAATCRPPATKGHEGGHDDVHLWPAPRPDGNGRAVCSSVAMRPTRRPVGGMHRPGAAVAVARARFGRLRLGGQLFVDYGDGEHNELVVRRCDPPQLLDLDWSYGEQFSPTLHLQIEPAESGRIRCALSTVDFRATRRLATAPGGTLSSTGCSTRSPATRSATGSSGSML